MGAVEVLSCVAAATTGVVKSLLLLLLLLIVVSETEAVEERRNLENLELVRSLSFFNFMALERRV